MGRWSRRVAREFVEWLEAEPRAHWLDVGCGTGALTAAICEWKKPASVIGCDPSGPLVEMASATLPDKRVSFEIAQAEHLPEREGGFDVVVSGLVLNFIPNARRGLAAMRARLAARGCVAAYVWDYAQGMQFLQHFWREAVALDPSAAKLAEELRFADWNETTLAALFREAGLARVQTRAIAVETSFASFEDFWQPFLGRTGPAPSYVAALAPERREALQERLRQHLPTQSDGRICLSARAWAARGFRDPEASN
jgi:ubiquinone/menaquinone biosynthesis C-methylase UbiE